MSTVLFSVWLYGYFLWWCLIPSLIFGVIFQFFVSRVETRKYTVTIIVFLSLLIGLFISVPIVFVGIWIDVRVCCLFVATISISTSVVCALRKHLLDRRKVFVNSLAETIYTILFVLFITPLIMLVVFPLLYFIANYLYAYRDIFMSYIHYLLPIKLYF